MKIGIQGGQGSYHEQAAQKLRPDAELIYCATFTELFRALKNKQIERGIVAIANNRVQFITDPYEYLTANDAPYQIVGETYLRIEHALVAPHGAKLESIQEVHSQAPAIGQCSHFLESVLPDAHIIEETDTALAAMIVAEEGKPHKAAIASVRAAKLHDLSILQKSVQNDSDNVTRFLEIALKNDGNHQKNADKTTMMLETPQVPGALVNALLPFQAAGINLSSLQSKLIPNSSFEMQFFIEFEAGSGDKTTQDVLKELNNNGYGTRILGSYKKAKVPMKGKGRVRD